MIARGDSHWNRVVRIQYDARKEGHRCMLAIHLRRHPAVAVPIALGCASLAAACQAPTPPMTPLEVREALHRELQLVTLKNCTLARYGSAYDGGYLLCQNLIGDLGAGYSYGVGPNDEFGCDISTRYRVPVHQYDCFDPARPACPTGRFVFHDECISDQKAHLDGRAFDTLANQIAANGDAGKRLIVKIDTEGAEWAALMAAPEPVLETIDQLALELHGVNEERFIATVRKLKQQFHLVNLNVNNMSCDPQTAPFPGWAYQVLFVNKRIGVVDPSAPVPASPSPLNALDDPTQPACGT